jgi:hypothetical protein
MKRADEIWKSVEKPDEYMAHVEDADLEVLRLLVARLGSTGNIGAKFEALREATVAAMNSRLSQNQVDAMDRLNRSTTHLARVGIGVAVVAVIVGIIQLVIATSK